MGGSKAFFVGKGQRDLVRQAKVQGFVGIEEGSVGSPKTSEKSEQGYEKRSRVGAAFKPLFFLARFL